MLVSSDPYRGHGEVGVAVVDCPLSYTWLGYSRSPAGFAEATYLFGVVTSSPIAYLPTPVIRSTSLALDNLIPCSSLNYSVP